jgi:hypothetical protein
MAGETAAADNQIEIWNQVLMEYLLMKVVNFAELNANLVAAKLSRHYHGSW